MGSDSTLSSFTWRAELAGRTTLHTFRLARFSAMLWSPLGFPFWVRHLLWRSCSPPPLPEAGICADVYAAHASFTSVLRPGTAFMCCALTSSSVKLPSSTFQIGFHYTPVDSMAACVQPAALNHSRRISKSAVIVVKVRTVLVDCPRGPGVSRHATIVFLCTSSPAQRAYSTSIVSSS